MMGWSEELRKPWKACLCLVIDLICLLPFFLRLQKKKCCDLNNGIRHQLWRRASGNFCWYLWTQLCCAWQSPSSSVVPFSLTLRSRRTAPTVMTKYSQMNNVMNCKTPCVFLDTWPSLLAPWQFWCVWPGSAELVWSMYYVWLILLITVKYCIFARVYCLRTTNQNVSAHVFFCEWAKISDDRRQQIPEKHQKMQGKWPKTVKKKSTLKFSRSLIFAIINFRKWSLNRENLEK